MLNLKSQAVAVLSLLALTPVSEKSAPSLTPTEDRNTSPALVDTPSKIKNAPSTLEELSTPAKIKEVALQRGILRSFESMKENLEGAYYALAQNDFDSMHKFAKEAGIKFSPELQQQIKEVFTRFFDETLARAEQYYAKGAINSARGAILIVEDWSARTRIDASAEKLQALKILDRNSLEKGIYKSFESMKENLDSARYALAQNDFDSMHEFAKEAGIKFSPELQQQIKEVFTQFFDETLARAKQYYAKGAINSARGAVLIVKEWSTKTGIEVTLPDY